MGDDEWMRVAGENPAEILVQRLAHSLSSSRDSTGAHQSIPDVTRIALAGSPRHRFRESHGDSRSNSGTVLRPRLNRQLPSDQSQPLSHSGQPESVAFYSAGIEPGSRIMYDQLNFS